MSEMMTRWFARLHRLNGVAAYGLRSADGACYARTWDERFTEAELNDLWPKLTDIAAASIPAGESAQTLRWTFDKHVVTAVARPHGAAFFALQASDGAFDSNAFAQFCSDFQALRE